MKHALSKSLEGRAAAAQIPRNTTKDSGGVREVRAASGHGRGDR